MKADEIRKGPPCSVDIMLANLSAEDKKDFDDACADPTIASSTIARVLSRRGHTIRQEAIRRHRKKECRCV
jgi:hypothetical protein